MSSRGRQKQRERFLLERFFDALGLPVTIIEDNREAPDFIAQVEGRKIGVELTDVFIHHQTDGNLPQAQESISERIVSSARQLYQESGAPPAHVSVCFSPASDLRQLDRDGTAVSLASFVRGLNLIQWQRVDWRPEQLHEPLPSAISFVHALGVPTFEMAHWAVARAGWVAPLTVGALQSRVDGKADKLLDYQKVVAENWLVVVADRSKPSQLLRAVPDFNPRAIRSPFAKTFYYGHPDKEVIQLGE